MEVLMLVWALEAPPSLFKTSITSISTRVLEEERVRSAFRNCVIRVWRAYNSPDARKSRLKPSETTAERIERRDNIMKMLGFEVKAVDGSALLYLFDPPRGKDAEKMGINEDGGIDVAKLLGRKPGEPSLLQMLGVLGEQLHVPFNTRELLASRHVGIDRIKYTSD